VNTFLTVENTLNFNTSFTIRRIRTGLMCLSKCIGNMVTEKKKGRSVSANSWMKQEFIFSISQPKYSNR